MTEQKDPMQVMAKAIDTALHAPSMFIESGMTLRDYFAGQALAGLCARIDDDLRNELANGTRGGVFVVRAAYQLADKMLEVRK